MHLTDHVIDPLAFGHHEVVATLCKDRPAVVEIVDRDFENSRTGQSSGRTAAVANCDGDVQTRQRYLSIKRFERSQLRTGKYKGQQ